MRENGRGPGHYHIDLAAAALGANQPLAPLWHGCVVAILLGHFRRIGLDLVLASLAPHDEPNARPRGIAKRHRRARVRFRR